MEHEIYVPFSATVVRAALADPERIARWVPGFQLEAGEDPSVPGGRLRLRAGGSTITYRGTFSMAGHGEGFVVEAEGAEARGNGSAQLRLTIVPRPVEDGSGTTLVFSGAVEATGRLTQLEPRQRKSAAKRLMDRFTEALVADLPTEGPAGLGLPDDDEPVIPGIPAPGDSAGAPQGTAGRSADAEGAAEGEAEEEAMPSEPAFDREDYHEGVYAEDPYGEEDAPEADLARRTMIGRSAEEVDHAPPRGRYAPEPPPGSTTSAKDALRWAAPAAAIAVAGALVIRRTLRRRN